MPEQPDQRKQYTLKAAAKALKMSAKRIRVYCRLGIFPEPIREPGDRGGFWYQDRIDWMTWRRDHIHEFRLPKFIRAELDRLLPPPTKRNRGVRTPKNSDS